eukprot:COSAG06_NODE_7316_length_2548_cov_1.315639_1_plen_212_part_00
MRAHRFQPHARAHSAVRTSKLVATHQDARALPAAAQPWKKAASPKGASPKTPSEQQRKREEQDGPAGQAAAGTEEEQEAGAAGAAAAAAPAAGAAAAAAVAKQKRKLEDSSNEGHVLLAQLLGDSSDDEGESDDEGAAVDWKDRLEQVRHALLANLHALHTCLPANLPAWTAVLYSTAVLCLRVRCGAVLRHPLCLLCLVRFHIALVSVSD